MDLTLVDVLNIGQVYILKYQKSKKWHQTQIYYHPIKFSY